MFEAGLIHRLKQARPQLFMHGERSIHNGLGNLGIKYLPPFSVSPVFSVVQIKSLASNWH